MIHLYVGNGKGKSTAVAGMAIRLLSYDKKVLLVSFLKGGDSGELIWLRNNSEIKELYQEGLTKFVKNMTAKEQEETKAKQKSLLKKAISLSKEMDAVILDEFTDIIDLDIITPVEAVAAVTKIHKNCEVIITGHKAINNLIELADYFTEFIQHKHPFTKGQKARKGIEF